MRRALAVVVRALGLCGALACGPAARGDVLSLYDGRRFEGTIVSETPHEIAIDTIVNTIRLKMTFRKSDVRTTTRSPLPAGFFDGAAVSAAPAAPAAPKAKPAAKAPETEAIEGVGPGSYLEVPLVGTFGRDIYPKGVEAALKAAADNGVKHVVFRIKSPGGEVWAARKIMEVLAQYDGKVTTHAMIEEAMSAAIWVVFSCDTVEIVPGGSVGAAVVFKRENTTGAAEVDAKMNSGLAAQLGSMAERHGRDPAIVRAMMMPDAELYVWEEKGKAKVSGQRPNPEPPGLRVLSNTRDVLTLTADEAVQIGLAAKLPRDDAATVGQVRKINGWRPVEGVGAKEMSKYAKASSEYRGDLERIVERVKKAIVEAVSADPERFTYEVDSSGEMSLVSKRRWTELTDRALVAWRQAKDALTAYHAAGNKAPDLAMEGFVSRLDTEELKTTLTEIDQKMVELRKGRIRSRLPAEFEKKH